MKAIVFNCNYANPDKPCQNSADWYIVADSAVSNVGKPFYLPDEFGETVAALGLALRINRLGKGIQKKFAQRYFQEMSPALVYSLPQYALQLTQRGASPDPALSFDRCLMAGEPIPFQPDAKMELKINGDTQSTFSLENLNYSIGHCIENFTRINTIKMGDILIPGISPGIRLNEGDFLQVFCNGIEAFMVKVK